MKRHAVAFFIIGLTAELGTTWLQKLRTTTDAAPGLYYPNFEALLLERMVCWGIIFLAMTTVWLFVSSRMRAE